MKITPLLLCACSALLPLIQPTAAQEYTRTARNTTELPGWLIEFSNLPREDREQYLRAFTQAKRAYQNGQWVACIGFLADCEMIFSKNPNVWNLRASCLMEQKFFDEAAEELERVRKVLPSDPVTANLSGMHLARGRYEESLAVLRSLQESLPYGSPRELLDVLDFRCLLCHVLLDHMDEARALVAHLSPMSDTPLYYYSQAVFALKKGDRIEASRCLRVVSNIFTQGNTLVPYQRALDLSGIARQDTAANR